MDDELIPVHVSERHGHVSVVMLLETPSGQMARYEGDLWKEVGFFTKYTNSPFFTWYYDEEEYGKLSGTEATRKKAIDAILDAGGYREVPDTATIPDLLDGLE